MRIALVLLLVLAGCAKPVAVEADAAAPKPVETELSVETHPPSMADAGPSVVGPLLSVGRWEDEVPLWKRMRCGDHPCNSELEWQCMPPIGIDPAACASISAPPPKKPAAKQGLQSTKGPP
jgi:hypothetical protein